MLPFSLFQYNIKPISHIIGTGIDIIEIARVEQAIKKFPQRFQTRLFTKAEQFYCNRKPARQFARYAMLFAAKEACSKALGTGLRQNVFWCDMEVKHLLSGQPTMLLHHGAKKRAEYLIAHNVKKIATTEFNKKKPPEPVIHISLTDEKGLAMAFVLLGW